VFAGTQTVDPEVGAGAKIVAVFVIPDGNFVGFSRLGIEYLKIRSRNTLSILPENSRGIFSFGAFVLYFVLPGRLNLKNTKHFKGE